MLTAVKNVNVFVKKHVSKSSWMQCLLKAVSANLYSSARVCQGEFLYIKLERWMMRIVQYHTLCVLSHASDALLPFVAKVVP